MKLYTCLVLIIILLNPIISAQTPFEGLWKGTIIYSNVEVPFNFEVDYPENSRVPVLTFINGTDRASLNATIQNDSLIIPMFAFDITLKMSIGQKTMDGVLIKHYSNRSYPFRGEFGRPRFDINEDAGAIQVGEKWDMTIDVGLKSEYPAVGLFKQNGSHVTGTIITEVSDYRFFEGRVENNMIEMSIFDGVHSFLLKGTFDPDKQIWSGNLTLDDGYSRPWVAKADNKAELPDPFEIVDLTGKKIRPDLTKLAVITDQSVNIGDYKNKVLVIQLMGTWCSNSQDQTRYLTKWISENDHQNVEILAVNYEANYSPEYGIQRIETYKNRLDIPYNIILGGPLSKTKPADAFSFIDKIMAFPTLVFIDKEGYARYVHSYFTGPATGDYYTEFDQRFNAIIDELTAE